MLGFGDDLGRMASQRGIRIDAGVTAGGDEFEETVPG